MKNTDKFIIEKTEYETAVSQFRHFASLRRQDMAFVTTFQTAMLVFIKDRLNELSLTDFFLTIIAFLVLVMGLNNERRLYAYMFGYMKRARQIEINWGMSVLHYGYESVKKLKYLKSNRDTFQIYYFIFILLWFIIWLINIIKQI